MILSYYFIGLIEDNAMVFFLPYLIKTLVGCTNYIGYPSGYCRSLLTGNEPVTYITSYLLTGFINPVFAYNILICGSFLLTLLLSFKFFKNIFSPLASGIISVVFVASPYFSYQSRSHIDLIQFWPVIWFLNVLFFSKNRYKSIHLGLILSLITGISNYLGYFTLLFSSLYSIVYFLVTPSKISVCKKYFSQVVVTLLTFMLVSLTFLTPYIRSNYLMSKDSKMRRESETVLNRPFEDFIIFSSRPWYYLIPSVDNPFLGAVSQVFLTKISSGGNYLTTNYFKSEHSASFLGLINLSLAVAGFTYLLINIKARKVFISKLSISPLILSLCIFGLVVMSMSPFVSVSGISFYTPSFLLFKVFPMFRVLTRLGVLILFLTLIFTGYGYEVILKYFPPKNVKKYLFYTLSVFLAFLSLLEFYIPIKITNAKTPPAVYTYIKETDSQKSPIVVYPYSKTSEAVFWISTYNKPLINPRSYENLSTGFKSEDFTADLITLAGLEKARDLGAKYLVYFYEEDKYKNSLFFNNVNYLKEVDRFAQNITDESQITMPFFKKFVLAKILNVGTGKSSSAILYSFQ